MYKMFSMRNQETSLTVVDTRPHSSDVPVHSPTPSPALLDWLLF